MPSQVAERLIVLGFLKDVLDHSKVPGLRAPLADALATRLEATSLASAGANA